MAEFLVLPNTFIEYVSQFRRIPIPPDTHLETLRSEIELVCLEIAIRASSEESSVSRVASDSE